MKNVPFCVNWGQNAQVSVIEQVDSHYLVIFGARLREARKRSGMSQGDFATLGGVHLNSQSKYEKGATEPSATYFANLANAGIDVGWLLTGRQSAERLDEASSAIIDATRGLSEGQRSALLAFLATL